MHSRAAGGKPERPLRGARAWPATILTITALAFAALGVSGLVDQADSDPPLAGRATVTVASTAPAVSIPGSWLGLSTEYWTLPLFAPHETILTRVLGQLRVPGGGPLVLRIGGDSADHAFWRPAGRKPPWALALNASFTRLVTDLVHRVGLRLILDLNLITGSPAGAARWARAALAQLPAHSVIALEVGNEPDLYSHHFWSAITAGGAVGERGLPATLTPAAYAADFRAYASALHRVAPGIPLLGPALARPRSDVGWVGTLLATHPRGLAAITVHRYPYTACVRHRRSPVFPTVARLLAPAASAGVGASVAPAIAAARRDGLPVRMTELNSVTCGGRAGVSNTFATALWAPSALFTLLREGISGVNLHVRANTINAPFALSSRGLTARPLLYGLILFQRALRPHAELVTTRVHVGPQLRLDAWTVRSAGRLRVVVINPSGRAVRARLVLPTAGPATVERLLGASPHAQSGVTLDGQHLDRAGQWAGRPAPVVLEPTRHGYELYLPRHSAALATVIAATAPPPPPQLVAVRAEARSAA